VGDQGLAAASRSAKSLISLGSLSGFCGDTSHQIQSSLRRLRALNVTDKWPRWGGLNDPPNSPMRCPSIGPGSESGWPWLGTNLAVAAHLILEGGELFQATGPRACSLPVAMPISAPNPNSPPSANWVEALCSTMALSTSPGSVPPPRHPR
jgi:hypothetical protein